MAKYPSVVSQGSPENRTNRTGPSTTRMKPTHVMEGNLHYAKSTDLKVNLIQKTPSQKHPG